jgi:hypothetical protein
MRVGASPGDQDRPAVVVVSAIVPGCSRRLPLCRQCHFLLWSAFLGLTVTKVNEDEDEVRIALPRLCYRQCSGIQQT